MVGFTFNGVNTTTALGLTLVMGALIPALIYVLMRQLGSPYIFALIASVLFILCGQAIQSSIVIMADIPSLFWAILSAVVLIHYTKSEQVGWMLLAGFILALASVTRWLYLILALPYALIVLRMWGWRLRVKPIVGIMIVTGIVFIPQLIYSTTTPYPTFNHAWVEGWQIGNAFAHEFTNVDGYFNYPMVNWRFYGQVFYDVHYLAPVFTPFILIGVGALIRQRRFTWVILLLGWIILPYLFLVGIPYQNIRFPLIVMPALVMCVGIGMEAIYQWAKAHSMMRYVVAGSLLLISGIGVQQMVDKNQTLIPQFIENQQRDKQVAYWLSEWIPEGSTLYTFGITLTVQHYNPSYMVREIYYETPDTLQENWVQRQDDYLLLNVWQIENQWAGREPQIVYHWLDDTRGLTQLARYGNYTLFRIEG